MSLNSVHFSIVLWGLVGIFSPLQLSAQVMYGFTEPEETIAVAFAESGILESVHVRQGDTVEAGDVLAALNCDVLNASRSLAVSRAESTASIEAARVEVKLKQRQQEKLSQVKASGHASSLEIEQAIAELDVARANLKLAEEQIRQQELEVQHIQTQIKQRILKSPAAGVVVRVQKRPGEFLSTSEPNIITLVKLNRLRIKFYITTEQAIGYEEVDKVLVMIDGKQQTADVDFLSPVTEADSGTVRLEVLLDNSNQQFRSGLPCRLVEHADIQTQTAAQNLQQVK